MTTDRDLEAVVQNRNHKVQHHHLLSLIFQTHYSSDLSIDGTIYSLAQFPEKERVICNVFSTRLSSIQPVFDPMINETLFPFSTIAEGQFMRF